MDCFQFWCRHSRSPEDYRNQHQHDVCCFTSDVPITIIWIAMKLNSAFVWNVSKLNNHVLLVAYLCSRPKNKTFSSVVCCAYGSMVACLTQLTVYFASWSMLPYGQCHLAHGIALLRYTVWICPLEWRGFVNYSGSLTFNQPVLVRLLYVNNPKHSCLLATESSSFYPSLCQPHFCLQNQFPSPTIYLSSIISVLLWLHCYQCNCTTFHCSSSSSLSLLPLLSPS